MRSSLYYFPKKCAYWCNCVKKERFICIIFEDFKLPMRIFSVSVSIGMSLSLVCSSASLISSDFENWDPQYYHNGFSPDDKLAEDDKLAAQALKCEKQHQTLSVRLASLKFDLQRLGGSNPKARKKLRKEIRKEYAELAKKKKNGNNKQNTSIPRTPVVQAVHEQPTQAMSSRLSPYAPVFSPVIYAPYAQAFFMQPLPRTGIEYCNQRDRWVASSDDSCDKHQRFINEQVAVLQGQLLEAQSALKEFKHKKAWANFRHQKKECALIQQQMILLNN